MIVNEEIKLNKRQPTWNYILNDLALYSLMTKVIHSEEVTNQEKFDFMYQIELLQQENARLKDNWNKLNNWLEEQVKYLTEIDGQNIPLNDNFKFCSMNELYQTGKYSGFKETLEKIETNLKEN